MNSQAYVPERFSPPREGPALLQGLIICGTCGERMTVRYHQRAGQRIVPDYLCQRKDVPLVNAFLALTWTKPSDRYSLNV